MPRSQPTRRTYVFVSVLGVVIPLVLISYYTFGQEAKPRSTVRLVSVIFRHGDRTPTDTFPNDPYKDDSHWPDGWGALTKLGKQQLYKLGLFLRLRYEDFLPELYSPQDVYVLSSDHDRCLMSAQLCLAGLFPPTGRQVWRENLAWQPIPVHTIPRNLDKLIVVKKPCLVYEQQLAKVYTSDTLNKINKENKELYEYLSDHTGKKIQSILDVEFLFNTLEIEERNKMELPEWTKTVYPGRMRDLAALSLSMFTQTDTMKRLKGGPLVANMATHMSDKVLRTLKPDRKLYLYSGHDLTIVSVMRTLGFEELLKPENGAAILVELHEPQDGSQHFVRMFYLNDTEQVTPHEVTIPHCGNLCSLKSFIQITEPVRPVDWDRECQAG